MGTALIVDDVQTDLLIFTTYLESAGWRVAIAVDGEAALNHLSKNKPDIVFLDVVLPDKSGFEICRAIKEKSETNMIPVVLCSSKNTDMDRFWGLKQGADMYLTKPVDRTEFLDTLQRLVKT